MNFFPNNIKYLRGLRGLNQTELASSIGFKQSAWSGYESGASKPGFKDLMKIIEYFGISASELLEMDLQNVALNEKSDNSETTKNVALNVAPNVALSTSENEKTGGVPPGLNSDLIVIKDQLIVSQAKHIESLEAHIKYLQNKLDQMEFDVKEKYETQYTPRKEQKSA